MNNIQIKARELVSSFTEPVDRLHKYPMCFDTAKQCALIAVDELIKYHESLFDKGFKEVHIALSSPIKTYNDILNPLLKELRELKEEIEKL